jgi:hypothetical protein
VRNTEKIFEFVNDIKKIPDNINFFIPIYSGADTEIGDVEFSEKYEMFVERAGRKIMTGIKNFARP